MIATTTEFANDNPIVVLTPREEFLVGAIEMLAMDLALQRFEEDDRPAEALLTLALQIRACATDALAQRDSLVLQ